MIEAVVFDLDGTLLNTLDDIRDVVNGVLRLNGMSEKSTDEVKSAVGRGVEELVRKLIPADRAAADFIVTISDQIRTTYLEESTVKTRPYPGIPELLNSLKEMGMPMAVLTNKPQDSADRAVNHYFNDIPFLAVSGVSHGGPMKPSIEAVIPVLEKLGTLSENTMMVGDSDIDMDTAVNAGMLAAGVSWGFRDVTLLKNHGAHHIINHPKEIIELLGSGLTSEHFVCLLI